eukprot:10248063-Ditylum_brightwellii.AAC.1
MEGYDYPTCPPHSGNRTIGLYAESLTNTVEPQWSYLQSIYNTQYDRASIQRSSKRIMVTTKTKTYKPTEGYNTNAAP